MTAEQKQCLLRYLGYYSGDIDGIYGQQTKAAVERFQEAFGGIVVDGLVGQETDKALRHAVAYGMLGKEPDTKLQTGTFWDDIRYFTREEFRCPCGKCGGFPVEPEETMVRVVDEIRHRAGTPVTVVDSGGSGVRCPEHNAEVGGVANSEHLYGRAADLHSTLPPSDLKEIAEEVTKEMIPGRGGIGLYQWGVHVDVGKYSRWNG